MYTAGQSTCSCVSRTARSRCSRRSRAASGASTQDDAGRTYRNTNESALHVDLVPTSYFARNPSLLRTRGSYERLADDNRISTPCGRCARIRGPTARIRPASIATDGSLARFTSVCAPLVYRGDRLPAELYGNVFVAEPAANLVSRIIVADDGTGLRATKAYERGEFLASTDERFRPVYLSNAPDGTLYIVDMYRGIIEHRLSVTEYLRDQIVARKLEQPTGSAGSIASSTRRRRARYDDPFAHASSRHSWSRRCRIRTAGGATRRSGCSSSAAPRRVVPALVKLATERDRTGGRGCTRCGRSTASTPSSLRRWRPRSEDRVARVRLAAIRIAERWLGEPAIPCRPRY